MSETALAQNPKNLPGRSLEEITASVRMNTQAAGMHILQIGQDMLDAKALLDHGQWLPWLQSVGYSPRTAENWMRIAREVSPDSALSALPQAKVLALLALPAEERESFAQENAVDNKSTAEIKRLIQEKEAALREKNALAAALDKTKSDLQKERICSEHLQDELIELRDKPDHIVKERVVPEDYEDLKRKAARYDADLADAAQAAVEAEERARSLAEELERAQTRNDAQVKDEVREAQNAANDFLIAAQMFPYMPELVNRDRVRLEAMMKPIRTWVIEMQKALENAYWAQGEGAVS